MMIGIDFGTTNSGAAIWTPQGARMIETVDGMDTMPSAVAETESGFVTGRYAERQQNANPEFTFKTIKRYLGKDFNSNEHGHFQLAEGPDGKVWFKGRKGLVSGPQLVSEVLKSILLAADHSLGKRPTGAVIAVPVDFKEPQQQAIREAAKLAGLRKVELFEEPYAAALAFGVDATKFSRVAVYDLGGGTFDITILAMKDGATQPLGMNGVGSLGGVDFDARLVSHVADRVFADFGEDVRAKPHVMVHLQSASEAAKIDLSTRSKSQVYVENALVGEQGVSQIKHDVTVDDFEGMVEDLVVRTIAATQDALNQAGLKASEIEHVLLVGGQSRMPMIHKTVTRLFGEGKLAKGVKPEHAVSMGAALRAAEIEGRIKPNVLERIANVTTGIRRAGGVFVPIITKGSKLPAENVVELKTAQDGQDNIEIRIAQGEAGDAADNQLIWTHVVPLQPADEGEITVSMKVRMEADGRLRISVDGEMVYGIEREAAA